jgi:hypothetical protein
MKSALALNAILFGATKMEDEKVIQPAFERHAQTALVLLLVALLLWVGNTTQLTSVSVAEMKVELAFLKGQLQKPHVHPELQDILTRIDRCERQIVNLEEDQHGKK